jgi:UPF0755 protein
MSTKKLNLPIIVIGVFIALIIYLSYEIFFRGLNLAPNKTYTLIVKKGSTGNSIRRELNTKNILPNPFIFRLFARLTGYDRSLKAGEYSIDAKTSVYKLLSNIHQGDVITYKIRFQEGHTFKQLRQVLAASKNVIQQTNGKTSAWLMQQLDSKQINPEGMFFPDTYNYPANTTDLSLLKKSYAKMQQLLSQQWQYRATNLPYKNSYQALIMASLIETEALKDNERALIASVLLNRLRKKMRLQVDTTVMYGLNIPYGQPLTKQDLKLPTPYNTYLNYGLPPTPIAMPSLSSIEAALHPAISNYLYYVAKPDGSHKFSTTYEQHKQAIAKYLL